jgi:hypothetical protein
MLGPGSMVHAWCGWLPGWCHRDSVDGMAKNKVDGVSYTSSWRPHVHLHNRICLCLSEVGVTHVSLHNRRLIKHSFATCSLYRNESMPAQVRHALHDCSNTKLVSAMAKSTAGLRRPMEREAATTQYHRELVLVPPHTQHHIHIQSTVNICIECKSKTSDGPPRQQMYVCTMHPTATPCTAQSMSTQCCQTAQMRTHSHRCVCA